MYGALWRVLPGSAWVRASILLALFVAVVALLFTVVFPEIAPYMPFNDAAVGEPAEDPVVGE